MVWCIVKCSVQSLRLLHLVHRCFSKDYDSEQRFKSLGCLKDHIVCLFVLCVVLMAGPTKSPGGSGKDDQVNFDDPFFVHPSDNFVAIIVTIKLTGNENFRLWKTSMSRALKARNKLGFVDGTFQKTKINTLKQNGISLSDYFNKLDSLWKEFDGITSLTECTCEASVKRKDHSNLMKLMQFLSGLDDSYSQFKSHILLMEPLPNVKTTFSILSREESLQRNDFNVNFLSVHKVCKDSNCEVIFNEHSCKIRGLQSKEMVGNGKESGGLYYMNSVPSGNFLNANHSSSVCCVYKFTWHNRLGHPSDQALVSLKHKLNFENVVLPPCDVCHRAKQTRDSFPVSQHVTSSLGELIHLDVWGPYRVITSEGFRYFLIIVDDYTRVTWVYLLKTKEEVFGCVSVFLNILLNQFEVKVKTVRSDNGTEFLNHKMKQLFESKGILHQTSCVHTPQQNGIVERKHRHILNVARDEKFYESVFPFKLKFSYVNDKLNVHVCSSDPFSYDESLYSSSLLDNPSNDNFRNVHQLDGASADQYLDETSSFDVSNQFGETHVPSFGEMIPSSSTLTEESVPNNTNPFDDQSSRTTRSGRAIHLPTRFSDYVVERKHKYGIERSINYSYINNETYCFVSNLNKTLEPKTYNEDALDPNWVKAMNGEMEALYRNNTWEITDLPKGRKSIGSFVSWKIKKQSIVSRSSTESEYRALGSVACEVLWILKLLFDVGITALTPVNDLGNIGYFLGLEFNYVQNEIVVYQQKFIRKLLSSYFMTDCHSVLSSLPSKLSTSNDQDIILPYPTEYKKLIGKLNYLVRTRPDLSYSVQHLSQFNQKPTQSHFDSILHFNMC
uniref:Integrase catalytic domain-containing protein n=1 Tax=Lactuca sativa TaxID=4236 RepID=A0A9R1ULY0_LACSA|nr:hypothetical protein LSAT_V11C800419360 [Lactuca sativa]